ncbi:MAG: Gfo/Idh/MocA family oxidoreductase [Acidobacteriota bacterium]
MERLGVALAGPGWVAGQHLAALAARPDTEVKVVVGRDEADHVRFLRYRERFGLAAAYTTDYESAIRRGDVDAVFVCTPNFLHYEQARAALEARKHVFVEKPMALRREEVRDLVARAERAGVRTFVGHVARYYDAIRGLWRRVRDGEIGEVYYCEAGYWHEIAPGWKARRETAGNALLMAGCHALDMVWWMLGEGRPIREVFARSIPARRRRDFEYDPTMVLTLQYEDGALGQVAVSLESRMPYTFHLQVNGTEGTVRNNGWYSDRFPGLRTFVTIPADYPDDAEVSKHPFPAEIEDFVAAIRSGADGPLGFRRVAPVYELIFAAEESANLGRPVRPAVG